MDFAVSNKNVDHILILKHNYHAKINVKRVSISLLNDKKTL